MLQVDVDLVSIMSRTGFLPSESHRPSGPASLVSQGGSQVALVTAGNRQSASDGSQHRQDTPQGDRQAAPAVGKTTATPSCLSRLYKRLNHC